MSMPMMGGMPPMPPGIGGPAGLPSGLMPNKAKPPQKKSSPAAAKNKALADKLKGGGKK